MCVAAVQHGGFDVFLLAVCYSLLDHDALDDLFPQCRDQGISLIFGGVFNSGILATGATSGVHYAYGPASAEVLGRVRHIERICRAHDVAISAVALQFALAHPAVASVLLGASPVDQQARNTEAANRPVPQSLWASLVNEGVVRADAPLPPGR